MSGSGSRTLFVPQPEAQTLRGLPQVAPSRVTDLSRRLLSGLYNLCSILPVYTGGAVEEDRRLPVKSHVARPLTTASVALMTGSGEL